MTMYRVTKPLSTGHCPGDMVEGNEFKERVVEALLRNTALAPVYGPPVSELPGWTRRAETLEEVGICTAQEFLEADDNFLKDLFGYKTVRSIRKWKKEVMEWLSPVKAETS